MNGTAAALMFAAMLLLMAARVPIWATMFLPGAVGYLWLSGTDPLLAFLKGLAFARFARPAVGVHFSDRAVVAPYQGGWAFMFRVVNTHQSELVNAHVRVMLARPNPSSRAGRELIPLALERNSIVFFPLTWTIVHPITE